MHRGCEDCAGRDEWVKETRHRRRFNPRFQVNFGAPVQCARFRLFDGTVDEHPHLKMQNSTAQHACELGDLGITAAACLVGMDEKTGLYMRTQTFLSIRAMMMSQSSSQRTVDEETRLAEVDISTDWSEVRGCVLDTPGRLPDIYSETEKDDAKCDERNARQRTQCSGLQSEQTVAALDLNAPVLSILNSLWCFVCSPSMELLQHSANRTEQGRTCSRCATKERTILHESNLSWASWHKDPAKEQDSLLSDHVRGSM